MTLAGSAMGQACAVLPALRNKIMFNIIRDLASAYESLSYLLSQPAGLLFTQCGTGMDRTTLMWHWISGTGYRPGTECEQRDPRDVSDGLARAVEASGGLARAVETR